MLVKILKKMIFSQDFIIVQKKNNFQNILRITPDCPFINIHIISSMIKYFKKISYLI